MVCAKKTQSAVAAVATAASSVYQAYTSTGATTSSAAATAVASNLVVPINSTVSSNVAAAASSSSSAATAANAGIRGFNYGAFFLDYTAKKQADFEYEFERAQDLDGTSGWTSARLYTMSEFFFFPLFFCFLLCPQYLGTHTARYSGR